MPRTTDADEQRWILDLADRTGALLDDEYLPAALVEAIGARLRSEFSCYTPDAVTGPRDVAGDYTLADDVSSHLLSLVHLHPLRDAVLAASHHGPAPPSRISDVTSAAAWRENPIYREVLRPQGLARHTVAVAVTGGAPGAVSWYAFNRDRDFASREVALLARVQPMLALVHGRRRAPLGPSAPTGRLTAREREVLAHLARGLTSAATARRLGISKRTVDKHVEHVHAKLGTSGLVATLDAALTDQLEAAGQLGIVSPAWSGSRRA